MSADEGDDLAVAGMFDSGQEGSLRDPSNSDDGVANLAIGDNDCIRHSVNSLKTPCA
jgi:hypothetical protein